MPQGSYLYSLGRVTGTEFTVAVSCTALLTAVPQDSGRELGAYEGEWGE